MTWPKPGIKFNSLLIRGLLMSVMLTISVLGVRQMGGLQTWELQRKAEGRGQKAEGKKY
ncbi:hypothetical protein [Nostoc sp.]|uniref:hypothetical protein n=1 Tax=Nostoc sp. TaxID=1180 RepID=UPI002FF5A7E8